MLYRSACQTPIGLINMVSDGDSVIALFIEGQKNTGKKLLESAAPISELHILSKTRKWIYDYFADKRPDPKEIRLNPSGNEFKLTVWEILCEIPYGEVITYKEVAKRAAERLGRKNMSCQAVGGAIGQNPIPILIPCHRVVGSDGSLTGYSAGIDKKAKLLRLECARKTFASSNIPVIRR